MTTPAIRRYPKRKPPEPDLKTLGDAANEAAKREAAQWFFFVTILLTLAAIVGSTTHRVLFLEEPVKVPILSIELPLLGFYGAAPAIFLVLHFYLLAQVREMAGKVEAFLDAAEKEARGDRTALRATLRRLDPFPVVGLMAARRFGRPSVALWLMVWTTLAVAPVLLLLFVQVRFLPYHDAWLTNWHRAVLVLDLAVLWWLWPRGQSPFRPAAMAGTSAGLVATLAVAPLATALVLGFSTVLATVPGERSDRTARRIGHDLPAFTAQVDAWPLETFWWRFHGHGEVPQAIPANKSRAEIPEPRRRPLPAESVAVALRRALFDGSVDPDTQRPRSPFSRSLVLPDQDFLTPEERKAFADNAEKARETIARTRVLRGRDLRDAVLDRADLRRADLTGSDLRGAALTRAKLDGASLDRAQMQGASLDGAQMQGASLARAQMHGASLDEAQMQGALLRGAQMQGALLRGAQMQGALLRGAQMHGASLDEAQMQGASLSRAQMQGALLRGAQMQGALLRGAQMQGASLVGAQMQGALLHGAQMQGASLFEAQMQGASLFEAQMQGASLAGAQMHGASLDGAQMQGASLDGAQMQGASLDGAQMQGASLDGAQMQGASLDGAQMQGALLRGAQMHGASLDGAQMQGASLDGAQMQGASLDGAQMQGASLDGAQMQGASLDGAQMQGASLARAEAWRVGGTPQGLDDSTANRMTFGREPPCPQPRAAGGDCPAAAWPWSAWIQAWLALIPEGPRREEAHRRLRVLDPSHDPPEFAGLMAMFQARPSPPPADLSRRLGDLACDATNAPHVARGILRQISGFPPSIRSSDLGAERQALAARMAGEACPGAKGLTPDEAARLATIAEGRN